MRQRGRRIVILLACAIACASASAEDDLRVCLEARHADAIAACRQLAERLSADRKRLQSLASSLEQEGRHGAASAVFEVALGYYPNDRKLLQGRIRARSNYRSMVLIETPPNTRLEPVNPERKKLGNRTSVCWTKSWLDALSACERERRTYPEDAALQERTGDVLRSVGKARDALAAYDAALKLSPRNDQLIRKRQALARLDSESLVAADNHPAKTVPRTKVSTLSSNDTSVVAQLELLETLRERQLLRDAEYEERRAKILGTVFTAAVAGKQRAPDVTTEATSKAIDFSRYGRYKALIIGNNRYGKFQKLKTPIADVKAVGDLLRTRYGFDVTTLIDANRYQIAKALSELRQNSKAADNVLIYYAGHGYLDETTKRGYWLPIDAEPDNFANWISTSDVTDTLAGISARHALVIADSCFSGALTRAGTHANLDDREAQIDRLFKKRSRTVMTSGGLEPVLDSGRGAGRSQHSVFANALLDALRDNDEILEVSRLFVGLRDRVTSNAEQTPQFAPIRNAGHDGGEFMFVPHNER